MTLRSLGILGVLVGASVAVSLALQRRAQSALREGQASLQEQSERLAQLSVEHQRLSNLVARINSDAALSEEQRRELLMLRNEVGQLRQACTEKSKLEAENAQFHAAEA